MRHKNITRMLKLAVEVMDRGGTLRDLHRQIVAQVEVAPTGDASIDGVRNDQVACHISRSIWSVVPNPSRQYVIERLPTMGRNDRCALGLPLKHKQCCGGTISPPPLEAHWGWEVLCEVLPVERLPEVIASKRLADSTLLLSMPALFNSDPERACVLLEARFAGTLDPNDRHLRELLQVLCDAYDVLFRGAEKLAFLQRMADGKAGPLRADALQRLATVYADRGQYKLAWRYFKDAQNAGPDDPSLAHLEVMILLSEGRDHEAQQRARAWQGKLARSPAGRHGELASSLDWLQRIAEGADFGEAMEEFMSHDSDEWAQRLFGAIDKATALPADPQAFRLERAENAAPDESLLGRLVSAVGSTLGHSVAEAEHVLVGSDAIQALEKAWHQVWPLAKPTSTEDLPSDGDDVWHSPQVEAWVGFLESEPQAFNSLDILDDVWTAVTLIPEESTSFSTDAMPDGIVTRVLALAAPLLKNPLLMPWSHPQNRPALRLLSDIAYGYFDEGDADAVPLMRQILRLSPSDEYQVREIVVDELLIGGDDAGALAIIDRFPSDTDPGLAVGRVLACYRMGRHSDALTALRRAEQNNAMVITALLSEAVAPFPATSGNGTRLDEEREAWIYCNRMRGVWSATPGALEWLTQNARRNK